MLDSAWTMCEFRLVYLSAASSTKPAEKILVIECGIVSHLGKTSAFEMGIVLK